MVVHKPRYKKWWLNFQGVYFSYIHIIYMYVYLYIYIYIYKRMNVNWHTHTRLIPWSINLTTTFLYTILGPSKKRAQAFLCSWENLFSTLSPRNTTPPPPVFWSGFWESWDPKPMRPNRTPGASPTYHLRKKIVEFGGVWEKKISMFHTVDGWNPKQPPATG